MKHYYASLRPILLISIGLIFLSRIQAQDKKNKFSQPALELLSTKSPGDIILGAKQLQVYASVNLPSPKTIGSNNSTRGCSFGSSNVSYEKHNLYGYLRNYDDKPCVNRRIIMIDRNGNFRISITDSLGRFTIDSFETFNRMKIHTAYYPKQEIGFKYKFNWEESYVSYWVYNYVDFDLKKHYCFYKDKLVFWLPSETIYEKEKLAKAKFRFRDVKQLDTRYTDIYLRY